MMQDPAQLAITDADAAPACMPAPEASPSGIEFTLYWRGQQEQVQPGPDQPTKQPAHIGLKPDQV